MEIRTMTPEDWPAVARIYQQGIDSNAATFRRRVPPWEDFDKSHSPICRYVAVSNGEITGWAALTVFCVDCPYSGVSEISLYLDEQYRGRGLGVKLMRHIVTESEKHGFWIIIAQIFQDNTASIKMTKKCGFREVGYHEKVAKDRLGIWHNLVVLERRSQLPEYN